MAIIMVVLACNLWGFYNITLPMENLLAAEVKGNIGHFVGGIIITFLAIPCNAPYSHLLQVSLKEIVPLQKIRTLASLTSFLANMIHLKKRP